MVDTSENLGIGPLKIDGISVFFRLMAGGVGGTAGTLVLFMGFLLGQTLISSFTDPDTIAATPLAVFFVLAIQFFACLAASGLGAFLIGLTHTDKYVRIPQGLMQILLVNVVIFILIIPVYFAVRSSDSSLVMYVATLHFIFSSLTSAIVFEVVATERTQVLLGVYEVIISIFTGILLAIVVFMLSNGFTLIMMLPVMLWLSIGFIGGLVEFFYYQVYKRTGTDFLNSGSTYTETVAMEEEKKAMTGLQQ